MHRFKSLGEAGSLMGLNALPDLLKCRGFVVVDGSGKDARGVGARRISVLVHH